jgi:hypothetical protein
VKHEFARWTFDGIGIGRWQCIHCGLKVGSVAAKQLEGLPCR